MARSLTVALSLVLFAVCSALVLDRLPRHIPTDRGRYNAQEEEELPPPSLDSSVERRRIVQDPNQMAPFIMKPTWKAIYPFSQQRKREAADKDRPDKDRERAELADILRDDEEEGAEKKKAVSGAEKGEEPKQHAKTKRQSTGEKEDTEQEEEEPAQSPDFQDWLRREYYRNMARSFASMRRKRDSAHSEERDHAQQSSRREKRSRGGTSVSFEEVTDNLRAIEDVLFLDALQTIREAGEDYEGDAQKQRRIANDLSSAYDLETMRNALFHLRGTLGGVEEDSPQGDPVYGPMKKRASEDGDQCPPLNLLISDCSSLGDDVPDGPLKRLLVHACNWHEVCYTCGEVFGLTSDNCDVGFVEQSQTVCRGDVPCESTARLLLLPLRQSRVFFKRSNPAVCLVDSCVEDFLRQV